MKLAFNVVNSGLGNGGGSRTVILCSQILERLGHRCDIIGTSDRFTWFEHKPIIPYFPSDLDVVISTACTTVASTLSSNVPKKAWYIRAHEDWAMDEDDLVKCYKAGLLNIVNSKGLQKKLRSYGIESKVVYQGIDFDWWEDRKLRPKNKIRIGCLYTKQPRKRWKDFVALTKILGDKDYEYVGMGNADPRVDFLTDFVYNVNHDKLCDLYSSCHIFFLPTISEGLHNIGLESALCGCLLVGSDAPLNGMIHDYLFDNETGMVYPFSDVHIAAELIRSPNWSLVSKAQKFIIDNIGSREKNMEKLIELFEEL